MKPKDPDEVLAAYLAGEFETRNRLHDGVTTRTNYSGANTRGGKRRAVAVPKVTSRHGAMP